MSKKEITVIDKKSGLQLRGSSALPIPKHMSKVLTSAFHRVAESATTQKSGLTRDTAIFLHINHLSFNCNSQNNKYI